MVFILSALWWIRGLWKLPDGRDRLRGKLDLVLKGRAILSKSLIPFSVDGLPWWLRQVKRLPAMWETRVQFLGREDPLEKEMAIHSSTLAWKIPWTEESDRLQSTGSQRVGLDWATSLLLMGRALFPPCCLTWGQTMVEVMKIMVTSFKRPHACTSTLSAPTLQ